MILQVALLLAGLSVATGSICCPPQQFSAFQYITFVNSRTTASALHSFVYDGTNQRYLISSNRNDNNFIGTTKVIYDYKKKLGYSINTESKLCTTFPVQGQFEDQENVCVPSGAVSLGPLFYGYNRNRLNALSYTYKTTAFDGRQQIVETTVTKDGCVPIISTTTTVGGEGGNSLYTVGYNNFYQGLRDDTFFDIPSYC
ncbi:ependymin-related protein 1-like [Haliotis rubra]|uniref:ependymin-related protein 1-like n=1 Tax=Haliotis rubra TaxID=36100 RepID=UPI001EE4F576|nr:ependymin-related protein 1-like [Haliotis rubra]